MCESLKTQITNVVEDWIANCNDDICYNSEHILEPHAERNLRELYERKVTLVKFNASFGANIQVGANAYDKEVLCEVINFLMDMEAEMEHQNIPAKAA